MRRRIWDWIVGLTMIAVALVVGGIIAGLMTIPVALCVNSLLGLEGHDSSWGALACWIFIFALLHAAGFYDYYRRRKINYATGEAGVFHLLPRAIQRIRTGQEASGFVDAATGQQAVQRPINAHARALWGLILLIASIAAFLYGATTKGEWTLVLMGLGLIAAPIALAIIAQACLAYAGFIARKR